MFEPITALAGFLTIWAQLNNYGIDSEKNPHLKNIRVRRGIQPYRQDYTVYNPQADLQDSILMKNILRSKRQAYGNNNNNMQNEYASTIIPLANYPPGSEYYSQNTNGIPYYYNALDGNNKLLYNNVAYYGNNNGHNANGQTKYQRNQISSKLIISPYGINTNRETSPYATYNPYAVKNANNNGLNNANYNGLNNANNNGLNNANNNGLNNANNNAIAKNKRNETVLSSSFMGSSWCPEFLKSVTIGGVKACISEDGEY